MKLMQKLKEKARRLKLEAQTLIIAYKDSRTPLSAKILIWNTVGYLLSPIDLIPDFIPILGLLDDLVIVPLLITASLRLIPATVLLESREAAKSFSKYSNKKNLIFGCLIITIWIILILFAYRYFAFYRSK